MTLHTLSAIALRSRFEKGEVSAEEIARYFLTRIELLDPTLKAFITVLGERTLHRAKALDEKKKRGEKLGKLAAIPIAIKDNIHLKGVRSTCASRFLSNYIAPFDATVSTAIEKEDGLIIGKTNLDEFAMGSSTENSAYFPSKNPWDTRCTPGGSSGGSAVAVASRMALLALGSDTGGSIRLPASFCGLVGFKPTYGRVSRFGLVAYGSSLDQIGPFATTAEDTALLMEVIGGHCEKDSTSIQEPKEEYRSFISTKNDYSGMRIGVPMNFLKDLKKESRALFDQTIEKLKSLQAEIVEVDLSILDYSLAVYYVLATAEASTNLARFDGIRYGVRAEKAESLDDVYDMSKEQGYGKEVKRRILLGTFVLSAGYQDAYYKKAQKVRTLIIEQFEKSFQKAHLIAMPVSTGGAFEFGANLDPLSMYLEDIYTTAANLAGIPAISIPCGMVAKERPYGLQLLGPQKHDRHVLQAAAIFQKHTSFHTLTPPLAS